MAQNNKAKDAAKDVATDAPQATGLAQEKAEKPDPGRGLPKRFQELSGKAVQFGHVAIRKIFNHPEVREYGLNPEIVNRRGLRGWTPTTRTDINNLVSQGVMSKEEANTFEYDTHGYVKLGPDTVMGWMSEPNARKRESEMERRSRIKSEGLKQRARDRLRDAARDVDGIDIDFDAEEQVEETLHFGSE
jgi:hypothetical protein